MFGLILLFSSVFAIDYTDCLNGTGPITLDSLETDPDPMIKGENVTVSLAYTVNEEVSTLNCTATLKILIIPIFKYNFDMCEFVDCPLPTGSGNFTQTVEIPSLTPSGTFGVELTCQDANENENLCLKANITVKSG